LLSAIIFFCPDPLLEKKSNSLMSAWGVVVVLISQLLCGGKKARRESVNFSYKKSLLGAGRGFKHESKMNLLDLWP